MGSLLEDPPLLDITVIQTDYGCSYGMSIQRAVLQKGAATLTCVSVMRELMTFALGMI